ncbi:MAG TPA: glycosyl hydrolase [Acidimicrobiales bacterium]|nr:glycosyl hydrolase [Acidimicrobiales bacterium]
MLRFEELPQVRKYIPFTLGETVKGHLGKTARLFALSLLIMASVLTGCSSNSAPPAGRLSPQSGHSKSISTVSSDISRSNAVGPSGNPVVPSANSLYLGAFDNANGDNGTANGGIGPYNQLLSLESVIHRKVAIDLHYNTWTGNLASGSVIDDLDAGRIPLISWQCGASDSSVSAGQEDSLIIAQAKAIASLRHPVMIRWFWEMEYTGSNGGKQGANAAMCIGNAGPQGYISAWRHIVNIFRDNGATNVAWVFCPGDSSYGPNALADGVAASLYYPGNNYVDWIGEDAYSRAVPKTLPDLVAGMYQAYGNSGKPLIVCETGAEGDFQPTFLASAAQLPSQFPNLKAIVYFDSHGPLGTYVFTPQGLAAFANLAQNPNFIP